VINFIGERLLSYDFAVRRGLLVGDYEPTVGVPVDVILTGIASLSYPEAQEQREPQNNQDVLSSDAFHKRDPPIGLEPKACRDKIDAEADLILPKEHDEVMQTRPNT